MSDSEEAALKAVVELLDQRVKVAEGVPSVPYGLEVSATIVIAGGVLLVGHIVGVGEHKKCNTDMVEGGQPTDRGEVIKAIETAKFQPEYMSFRDMHGALWRIRMSDVVAWGGGASAPDLWRRVDSLASDMEKAKSEIDALKNEVENLKKGRS